MKFNCLQENLKQCLNFLQKAIPNKPNLPILSSILMEAKDNEVVFSATDLYLGIKGKILAEVEKPGSIVIPGDVFKQMIYSFNPGKISFEQKKSAINVKSNQSKVKLPFQDASEYPDFPKIKGEKYELSKEVLEKIEKLVSFSTSTDQTRPILTSILLKLSNNGLEVVATDGFRLSVLLEDSLKFKRERTFLVPVKAISEVFRMMNQSQSEKTILEVSEELKQIKFIINGYELFVRLIEGDFPPYEKIIPDSYNYQVVLSADLLLAEIKRAYILAKDVSNIIKLKINNEKICVNSSSPSFGNYQGTIELLKKNKSDFEEEIAFNARYLLDFLNNTKAETVWIGINESLKPAMFKPEELEGYKHIIMPFRVNN
ncbi:MAG: DNA polymerase III subunit beta [Candidatus Woesebacteria bacterium]|jgi:DNA polymerase-3 subunit beta